MWAETYFGGSAEQEDELFRQLARDIQLVQHWNTRQQRDKGVQRAFHAKILAGIVDAEFRLLSDITPELARGVFRPGVSYRATLRFSSAAGIVRPDSARDLRGIAIRLALENGATQDFLLTNAPASHARDGRQFMAAATALASPKQFAFLKLVRGLGVREALRMIRALKDATAHEVHSLTTERFWSRAPYAIGPCAVKFKLEPAASAEGGSVPSGDDSLREDLVRRLKERPVAFSFQVQRYVNEAATPIEDGTVEWSERDAPAEPIADLLIPRQDLDTAAARQIEASVDRIAFSPWHTAAEIRPIGSLNRARRLVYEASAAHRDGRVK